MKIRLYDVMPTTPQAWPARDAVDIWRLRLDVPWRSEADLRSLLSTDEIKRADRFAIERPRRNFVIVRGCLRKVLALYLNCHAEAIRIDIDPGGKPFVVGGPQFNVAHSGDAGLIAVAVGQVGIDVEELRVMSNAAELVARYFSESERIQYESLPSELKRDGFFKGWICKEALLKAAGVGLADLESCIVDLDPREPARIVQFNQRAELHTLMIDGYAAAAAMIV